MNKYTRKNQLNQMKTSPLMVINKKRCFVSQAFARLTVVKGVTSSIFNTYPRRVKTIKQNFSIGVSKKTLLIKSELKVEDSIIVFETNPLFDLLEINIKAIHKHNFEEVALLLQDLKIKWSFLQKILNEKKPKHSYKQMQHKIETEILRLNLLHHQKGGIYTNYKEILGGVYEESKKPWTTYKGAPACVLEYYNKVCLNYDPTKILISAFAEVIASARSSEEAVKMKQTTFIFRIFKNFNKIYESFEYQKWKKEQDKNKKNESTAAALEFVPTKYTEEQAYEIGTFLTFRLRFLRVVRRVKEANRFKGEFFILIDNYRHTSSPVYINIESLPMFCLPKHWEKRNFNKLELRAGDTQQPALLINGGFLKDHSFRQKLYDNSKHESLDPHVIYGTDTMYLELSEKALSSVNYIQDTAFRINNENLEKILTNLQYYLEKEENLTFFKYESINDYVKDQPRSNRLTDELHYRVYSRAYATELMKFRKAVTTLFLAILFKGLKFYYVVYADFRSRLYRHGWPLNPMGNILSKLLLRIDGPDKETTTALDACASGFSIYGMLSGDKKLLELTRILKNDNTDFYLYMLAFLEKEIPILKNLKQFTGENLITRAYLKDILIPFMYNEGIKGTFKTLSGIEQLRDQVTAQIKDKKDPVFYIAYQLRKNLDLCFPNVPKIKDFLNKIIDCNFENRSLNLMDLQTNGYITSKMYYPEVIEQSIRVSIWKDQKWAQIKAIKQPRTLDKDKCKVAAAPNVIHSLDAFLMLETVRILKKKKIPVSTLHDCYIVLKCHRTETQLAYQEAVKALMKIDFLSQIKENPNNVVQSFNTTQEDLENKAKAQKKKFIKKMELLDQIILETKTSRELVLNEETFSGEPLKEDEPVFVIPKELPPWGIVKPKAL
jgi:hypothetical protein